MILFTLLMLTLLPVGFTQRVEHPRQLAASSSDVETSADTQNLIAAGEEFLFQNGHQQAVALVMGNTGAGKSTITKFITGHDLISYRSGTRFLIRDDSGAISSNSTMISKTLFPEKFVDNTTNIVYYDLPGFSDTRNSSTEIATAYLMKKVADHAERVKILFIVTYSSLMTGESRTEFTKLLKHAVQIVKNPSKFSSAIALVASKVDHTIPDDEVVPSIVEFLEQAKLDVDTIFDDEDDSLRATDLINAFLTKEWDGSYSRIGFFKQPHREGRLSKIRGMKKRQLALRTMVQLLKFMDKNTHDFGISVSDESVNYINNCLEQLNRKFVDSLKNFLQSFSSNYQSPNESVSTTSIARLSAEVERMRTIINYLKHPTTRREFLQTLEDQPMFHSRNEVRLLWLLHAEMEFFENIGSNPREGRSERQWLEPFYQYVQFLQSKISALMQALNALMVDSISRFVNLWKAEWNASVVNQANQSLEDQRSNLEHMSVDTVALKNSTDDLANQTSTVGFLNALNASYRIDSVSSAPHEALPLHLLQEADIPFSAAPRLRKEAWVLKLRGMQHDIASEVEKYHEDYDRKEQDAQLVEKKLELDTLVQQSAQKALAMQLRLNHSRQLVEDFREANERNRAEDLRNATENDRSAAEGYRNFTGYQNGNENDQNPTENGRNTTSGTLRLTNLIAGLKQVEGSQTYRTNGLLAKRPVALITNRNLHSTVGVKFREAMQKRNNAKGPVDRNAMHTANLGGSRMFSRNARINT